MNFGSFFDDLGDNLQTSAQNVFSNYVEIAASQIIEKNVPLVRIGQPPQGNLTAKQVQSGQTGSNILSQPLTGNGQGFSIQNSLLKLGPIGIIGIALIAGLIWRFRK